MNRAGRLWFMTDVDLHDHEKWLALDAELSDPVAYACAFAAFQYLCARAKRHHRDGVFASEREIEHSIRGLPMAHVDVLRRHGILDGLTLVNFAAWNERAAKDLANDDRATRRGFPGRFAGYASGYMTGQTVGHDAGQLSGPVATEVRSPSPSASASTSDSDSRSRSPKPSPGADQAQPRGGPEWEPESVLAAAHRVEKITGRPWTYRPASQLFECLRSDVAAHGLDAVLRAMDSLGPMVQPGQVVFGTSRLLNPIPKTGGRPRKGAGAAQDPEAVRRAFVGN